MFICEPCLDKNYENFGIAFSLGKCEECGKVLPCNDIPSKFLVIKEPVKGKYNKHGILINK